MNTPDSHAEEFDEFPSSGSTDEPSLLIGAVESVRNANEEREFVRKKLQELRKRLLDLTARNPLLSFRHPAASIRVVDELPNQVADALQSSKAFSFEPVPKPSKAQLIDAGFIVVDAESGDEIQKCEPTAEAWAKHLGIQTAYELPISEPGESKHRDSKLQTLLFPEQLEAKLRSIRTKANSAVNEMGCNILFLAVGFLEWYESDSSDLKRIAPLYTVGVDIARDRLNSEEGTFRYKISPRGEDVFNNVTLREKLSADFGLALPRIEHSEDPEQFFDQVQEDILRHQPRWKVHRYISLATFNFQKQAMYEDLDPSRWDGDGSILDHDVIQAFFTATERDDHHQSVLSDEYRIDSVSGGEDRYPVIFDADSSQHSAIIDALEGKNLVIEGPPGTGKSQTISNLIAASLAAGKTVLFVAEKMAALEVVKERLARAGLGHFCLELHGHKGQKSQVIGELSDRMSARFRSPSEIQTEKQLLAKHRETLNAHAKLINSPWKSTEISVHNIFAGAVRYRSSIPEGHSIPEISGVTGEQVTPLFAQELLDETRRLAALHAAVAAQTPGSQLTTHYWYGVRSLELLRTGHVACLQRLKEWTQALESLHTKFVEHCASLGIRQEEERSVQDLVDLATAAGALPALSGRERLDVAGRLAGFTQMASETVQSHDALHAHWQELSLQLHEVALKEPKTPDLLNERAEILRATGASPSLSIQSLESLHRRLGATQERLRELESSFAETRSRSPASLASCFQLTRNGLVESAKLLALIKALPSNLWRHREELFDNADLDPLLEELRGRLHSLLSARASLTSSFPIDALPAKVEIQTDHQKLLNGGLFRWASPSWRSARRRLLALASGTHAEKKRALHKVPQLLSYLSDLEETDKLHSDAPLLGGLYKGADTPIEQIEKIRTWYRAVRAEYGSGFGDRSQIGDAVITLDRDVAAGIAECDSGKLAAIVQLALEELEQVAQALPDHAIASNRQSPLIGSEGSIEAAIESVGGFLEVTVPRVSDTQATIAEVLQLAASLAQQFDRVGNWSDATGAAQLEELGFELSAHFDEIKPGVLESLRDTLSVALVLSTSADLRVSVDQQPDPNNYEALQSIPAEFSRELATESTSRLSFCEAGDVDLAAWLATGTDVQKVISRNQGALAHEAWITDWLQYLRIKQKLIPNGLAEFIRLLEECGLSETEVEDVTRGVLYNQLAKEVLVEEEALRDFYGPDQDGVCQQFRSYDKRVIELKQQEIASVTSKREIPAGRSGGRVGELTDRALVEHETQKQRRHIALRDLLSRAGQAVSGLKPCFMMSPMSVATHLEPGQHQFDLVVMDEASQIKPEDALGAIARGRSLVIVGDPKQLPPTSFFDRMSDDEPDSEDKVTLEDAESILDSVSGLFPTRRLRWHYRSRHESLIEFSAENFYDNDLVLFPSPFETNPEFGIKFHKVEDGFFQDRINRPEARTVIDALILQLENNPDESVGVVAMSASQRDLVEQELEQRMKSDAHVRQLVDLNLDSDEPLFFKNLESVQGDERDVIMISMTYGPLTPGSRVPQRFGPINRDGGWRRLNVLFTRSKKRMHIFSSMSSSDVLLSKSSREGLKALHNFLAYCERRPEHGAEVTGREPDSDFEISVMEAVERHGFVCVPQLGVAGYFLDLAVRDPENPGQFLLGIECDGATYHSAKSARDRDRLRQEVLEGLGWKILRVWSTDWFNNPELQTQRVLNALASAD